LVVVVEGAILLRELLSADALSDVSAGHGMLFEDDHVFPKDHHLCDAPILIDP